MLILPIKKKWYDMILSGEKKEEYRELKPYYQKRFMHLWQGSLIGFDAKRKVMFRNGYSKQSPSFIATVTLDIGTGKTEWGAEEEKNYFILKICDIEPQEGAIRNEILCNRQKNRQRTNGQSDNQYSP